MAAGSAWDGASGACTAHPWGTLTAAPSWALEALQAAGSLSAGLAGTRRRPCDPAAP